MEKLKEIEFFGALLKKSKNELLEKAIADGRMTIGYNCCMVPYPLLSIGGIVPVHLRAPEVQTTEQADFYMSNFNCSYSRSILEAGLEGSYDWINGIVFAASCIHTQRVEHNLKLEEVNGDKKPYLSYVIDTPRKSFDASITALASDLRTLGGALSQTYGVDASEKSVIAAIKEYNKFNKLLKEIADMRLGAEPSITGTELHTVVCACQVAPHDMLMKPLKDLKAALKKRGPLKIAGPRVMVMGARIDDPAFIQLIEDQGCFVAADRFCFGSLPGLEPIKDTGDPYTNLARHFMDTSECPRMMCETDKRMQHTFDWFDEYDCDGIILQVMKFCDLWGWETVKVQEEAEARGVPVVRFEREYHVSGEGQLQTRVQAFIESLNARALADASKKQEA